MDSGSEGTRPAAGTPESADAVAETGPQETRSGLVDEMSIVVVNYGSHQLIDANLGSLDLAEQPLRVVVVDNFSGDAERAAMKELAKRRRWTLVEMLDNRGFSAAVNAGIERARSLGSVCFMLLNPDARSSIATMLELRETCLAQPLAMIAPRIETSDGRFYFNGASVDFRTGRMTRLVQTVANQGVEVLPDVIGYGWPWLTGACVALHRRLVELVGPLNDSYFLYWEDVDYSRRVTVAGGELVLRRDLVVVHDEGGTQGAQHGRAKSNRYYYFNCRNRLIFGSTHLSYRQLRQWIIATPAASWEILMRGGKRQLLHSPGPLVAVALGTAVGLSRAVRTLVAGSTPDKWSVSGTASVGGRE